MSGKPPSPGLASGLAARWALWRARRAPVAKGFVSRPEPRSIGHYAKGKQLLAGNFFLAGQLITAEGTSIWDITPPRGPAANGRGTKSPPQPGAPDLPDERAGFAWLDDLAAVGDGPARKLAQDWAFQWMARYGHGRGPGWDAALTGRRLIRWVNHAPLLLSGRDPRDSALFFAQLSAQLVYLSRHWPQTAPGLARIEALTGLIYAALALDGMAYLIADAELALGRECDGVIAPDGGISSRNPEELLQIFTLLTWAEHAMVDVGRAPPKALSTAIERIAPALRILRHADGGLARFHGGGGGSAGQLDQSLALAGIKAAGFSGPAFAMGFARLSAGRTSVIVDIAPPPQGDVGAQGHASTAAFELTSGRRPMIVSCGSGRSFGPEWVRAGRATASHSALSVDGSSSSRLLPPKRGGKMEEVALAGAFADAAQVLDVKQAALQDGMHLSLVHDGWSRSHGLQHKREFWLTPDGRALAGLDRVFAQSETEKLRFGRVISDHWVEGIGLFLRFHLHPDVDATLDLGGNAVSLALKSGEIWVFRHDSAATLTLEPSIYLENARLRPRPTNQIVLTLRARNDDTRIGWTLAKAKDTPLGVRDLDQDDLTIPI
jgi:uncharacterized heparinase superfamily protein